jgi:2-oxoisovalerate dehydrogenase E2 component (dihydrolipoyl transacylase)
MPDLGEGTVSAEILDWRVAPGDVVNEDDVIVEVMTEKASIEVPAPVSGRVISISGTPGDMIAVGSELIVFDTAANADNPALEPAVPTAPLKHSAPEPAVARSAAVPLRAGRTLTSPALRRRAKEAGIELAEVPGTGPKGRITRKDFDAFVAQGSAAPKATASTTQRVARTGTDEVKIIGFRRVIAQRLTEAKRNIPHFAYVEEVDVTELESLRTHMNSKLKAGEPALTYLPFFALALARVLQRFPQCNALYDAQRGVLVKYHALHLGIATQTPDGLKVPVVRNVEARSLWDVAREMRRVAAAARDGKATKEELTGSTITLTSLGKLGGIVVTPIINAPEVAIIGVNRAVDRPVVQNSVVVVRRMMNISSSFDHRFVDGYDAAAMIQALKEMLEHPAMIWADE